MEIKEHFYRSLSTLCILTFLYLDGVFTETVYMDKYGDCFHEGPIIVDDEAFTIQSRGGAAYDTLICEMTFKSTQNDRLCLSFKELRINRCDLKLYAYSDETSSNNNKMMGSYTCDTGVSPETVCSEGKFLTVQLKKRQLSHDNYDFTLELRQYSQSDIRSVDTDIVTIFIIVGTTVGIIVIIVLTSIVVVCCCCNKRKYALSSARQKSSATSCRTEYTNVQPVQPTAPPLENPPAYSEHPPPYSTADNTASVPLNTDTITEQQQDCV